MKSNYKRLGNYIGEIDKRNRNLEIENLIGLSIQKKFIPSISNIIGTDMSTYRILNQNQFSYCSVTSRNGEKITIALYQEEKTAMVSQAYDVFEITNAKELLPEYLMMWFRRPEFDRYARFMSHGSVREMFSWEDMCEVMLPVPHPDKQKEIVKEYHTIVNRIALNNQLIQKLEETAQAIYKQWFVDFEFPNEEGKPYKSSGGEMEMNLELEKEIPKGWRVGALSDIVNIIMGQSPDGETYNTDGDGMPLVNGPVEFGECFPTKTKWTTSPTKLSVAGDLIVCVRGSTTGRFVKSDGVYCLGRGVCSFRAKQSQRFVDQLYKQNINKLLSLTTGSTFPNWDGDTLANFPILIPSIDATKAFDKTTEKIFKHSELISNENIMLQEIKNLLLSKLATIEN